MQSINFSIIKNKNVIFFYRELRTWCGTGIDLWHFRLWSFQGRDTKSERFLAKNQLYSNEVPNFENWSNGELSKIGHHFSNKWL